MTLASLLLGNALALTWGGWTALAVALPLSTWAGLRLLGRRADETPRSDAGIETAASDEKRLALQLVPVWRRNVEAARGHSERSMEQLLESFANVSGHLDQALAQGPGGSLQVGAVDELLQRHRGEIDRLLVTTRTAVRGKRQMLELMQSIATELTDMAELTRQVQNIGRATHLLALNASVEATRAGGSGGTGFAVVAHEVRDLAGQSREAGQKLARSLHAMRERLATLQHEGKREDADDDELELRAEQEARAVVQSLLGSIADISRASRNLQQAGRQVQTDLERIFVSLQSQDRLSQMLNSVTEDMVRYSAWLHGADDPAAATPHQWLQRLEQSYTMEEMRSAHHGNVAVEQSHGVEFF